MLSFLRHLLTACHAPTPWCGRTLRADPEPPPYCEGRSRHGPTARWEFPWGPLYLRGGCTKKAEGVDRLVLPGVRACAPFEGGILHLGRGGWVAHPLYWGSRGRVQRDCER